MVCSTVCPTVGFIVSPRVGPRVRKPCLRRASLMQVRPRGQAARPRGHLFLRGSRRKRTLVWRAARALSQPVGRRPHPHDPGRVARFQLATALTGGRRHWVRLTAVVAGQLLRHHPPGLASTVLVHHFGHQSWRPRSEEIGQGASPALLPAVTPWSVWMGVRGVVIVLVSAGECAPGAVWLCKYLRFVTPNWISPTKA